MPRYHYCNATSLRKAVIDRHSLHGMEHADLNLPLADRISLLVHITDLETQVVAKIVAVSSVEPVTIESVHTPTVTDVFVEVCENLVVKGQVVRTGAERILV